MTPAPVFETSGHVARFADWMVKDTKTGDVLRAVRSGDVTVHVARHKKVYIDDYLVHFLRYHKEILFGKFPSPRYRYKKMDSTGIRFQRNNQYAPEAPSCALQLCEAHWQEEHHIPQNRHGTEGH